MTLGLIVFIAVVALDVLGLLLDGTLTLLGLTTITSLVRGPLPWLGAPIIALQFVGIAGLVQHLYGAKLADWCIGDWMW